jgi:hypothetical protein
MMRTFWLLILLLAVSAGAHAEVRLPANADDCVLWAAAELKTTLGPAATAADIRVTITPKTGPDEQSYSISKAENAVLIEGSGSLGAMYGLQDVAEQIRNGASLQAIIPVAAHPFIEIRPTIRSFT